MSIDSLQLSIVEKVKSTINCNYDIDRYKLYELLAKEIINSLQLNMTEIAHKLNIS